MDVQANINITANTAQAQSATNALSNNVERMNTTLQRANTTLFSTTQVIRDLPFGFIAIQNNLPILIDSFLRLYAQTQSVKHAMMALGSTIMGPAGLTLAISAVISGLTYYSLATRGAKKETEALGEEIDLAKDRLNKLNERYDKYNTLLERNINLWFSSQNKFVIPLLEDYALNNMRELAGILSKIDEQRQAPLISTYNLIRIAETTIPKGYTKGELEKAIKFLRDAQKDLVISSDAYNLNIKAINNLNAALKSNNQTTSNNIDLLDRLIESTAEITRKVKEYDEVLKRVNLNERDRYLLTKGREKEVAKLTGGLPEIPIGTMGEDEMLDNISVIDEATALGVSKFTEMYILTDAIGKTITDVWGSAFEEVFGEANSLLEIFLKNLAEGLVNLASKQLITSIFGIIGNILLPGSGSAFAALGKVGGVTQRPIIMQFGNDTFQGVLRDNLPIVMERLTYERRL